MRAPRHHRRRHRRIGPTRAEGRLIGETTTCSTQRYGNAWTKPRRISYANTGKQKGRGIAAVEQQNVGEQKGSADLRVQPQETVIMMQNTTCWFQASRRTRWSAGTAFKVSTPIHRATRQSDFSFSILGSKERKRERRNGLRMTINARMGSAS